MEPPRDLLSLTVSELLDELAGPQMPGGGSACALAVAMACSVLAMAARASKGSWPEAGGIAVQADALRARAAPLAQADADAYEQALHSLEEPAGRRGEQRDHSIATAFARAAAVPLEIAQIAADTGLLAEQIVRRGDEAVRPDARAAAALAAAAARASAELVAVNLTALKDDERVAWAHRLAEGAESSARAAFSATPA